jgi:hypothetical protein
MPTYTSTDDADLEVFLSVVGKRLGQLGAAVTIDLYTDEPIEAADARNLLEKRTEDVTQERPGRSRKHDPLMGVELNLASEEDLRTFSLLGFRTIGCEAFIGKQLVFTNIENERTVWLDLSEEETAALVEQARQSGATSLVEA